VILVVGHFGTLYSYATVAGRVAEALRERGLLAGCANIDQSWHERWSALSHPPQVATHVVVVSAPNHYIDVYAKSFGRERSAIFVSPNTTTLDDEHAETISQFGMAIAPSIFCARTVGSACQVDMLSTLSLGSPVSQRLVRNEQAEPYALHFTSDQAWPSRKGTETLLKAWSLLDKKPFKLLIHGPPALRKDALYMMADLDIDQSVQYVASPKLGTSDEDICSLMAGASLMITPSRSEGFGMMMLAALVGGVPLVTTCNTAHGEFLRLRPRQWMGIPTAGESTMAYEKGFVPLVEPELLAAVLEAAMSGENLARMENGITDGPFYGGSDATGWGTWEKAGPAWAERLKEWMEDT
jgi:glycosyltransferase involved in cell wall biosynthesis